MATSVFLLLSALLLLLPLQTSYFVVAQHNNNASKKLYIAYLGEKQHEDPQKTTASHQDMLTRILGRQALCILHHNTYKIVIMAWLQFSL
uniref:Inhibitor I9 domain-containing protein n=1 Tax=Oryza nivara TaxID=4536 RepID=A0A0E0GXA8_ORYNI